MTTVNKIKIGITSVITLFMVACPFNKANAYDITTNVSPTGKAWEWGTGTGWLQAQQNGAGEINNTSTGDAIFWGRFMNNNYANNYWILKSIVSGNNIDFVEGNYYKTTLSFNIAPTRSEFGVQVPMLNRLVLPTNSPYKLVNIQPIEYTCVESTAGIQNFPTLPGQGAVSTTTLCARGAISYDIIVQATRTATGKLQFGDGSSWFLQSYVIVADGNGYGTLRPLTITEYKPESISEVNQEQQQAGEQAQQDGQQGSDNSQNDATQGTQSLLSAITGFVGVISNATPTNCRINGNMGALDLGNLDFCQDNPPAIITTIGTLILIGITIPITIWVIKKIISMFRSFTNG